MPATTNYSKLAKNEYVNKYSETASNYNGSQQMLNRRDNTAKSLGYSSFYALAAYIHVQFKLGKSGPDLAKELGKSDRHFPSKFISLWDMDKCLEEVQELCFEDIQRIRSMYVDEVVSVTKISEILGYEIPTIRYALSDIGESLSHSTLYRRLLISEEELLDEIEEAIVDGKTVRDIVLEKESSTKPILKYTEKAFRRLHKRYMDLLQASH